MLYFYTSTSYTTWLYFYEIGLNQVGAEPEILFRGPRYMDGATYMLMESADPISLQKVFKNFFF